MAESSIFLLYSSLDFTSETCCQLIVATLDFFFNLNNMMLIMKLQQLKKKKSGSDPKFPIESVYFLFYPQYEQCEYNS